MVLAGELADLAGVCCWMCWMCPLLVVLLQLLWSIGQCIKNMLLILILIVFPKTRNSTHCFGPQPTRAQPAPGCTN